MTVFKRGSVYKYHFVVDGVHDATLAFSNAVQELRRKIGTSPKDEYERLERFSNEARVISEQARLALERHIATHRC
jgi:hypothetical protein